MTSLPDHGPATVASNAHASDDAPPPPTPPRRPTRAEVEARWTARDKARAFHEALGGIHPSIDPRDLEQDHWTRSEVLVERGLVGGG